MKDGSWMVSLIITNPFQKLKLYNLFLSLIMMYIILLVTIFHVNDLNGNKLIDESVIDYMEQVNIINFLIFVFLYRIN